MVSIMKSGNYDTETYNYISSIKLQNVILCFILIITCIFDRFFSYLYRAQHVTRSVSLASPQRTAEVLIYVIPLPTIANAYLVIRERSKSSNSFCLIESQSFPLILLKKHLKR